MDESREVPELSGGMVQIRGDDPRFHASSRPGKSGQGELEGSGGRARE